MASKVEVVFGPPGCGKTTKLVSEIKEKLASGVSPSSIGCVTFTRRAAWELRDRLSSEIEDITVDDLPYVRTLHSLAFSRLGLSRSQVMSKKHWRQFGEKVGLDFSSSIDEEGRPANPMFSGASGDVYISLHSLARSRCRSLEEEWLASDVEELPQWALRKFSESLSLYKREQGLLGFEDFLDEDHGGKLPISHMYVDEAQDLTPQQWKYVRRITPEDAEVMLVGDDDQAIFEWAGADPIQLLRFAGTRSTLPKSWRLANSIKVIADEVIRRCGTRVDKSWMSREEEGSVDWVSDVGEVDLLTATTKLLLARRRHQLDKYIEECRRQGVVYRTRGVSGWSNEAPEVRAAVAYESLRRGREVTASEARLVASSIVGMPAPDRLEGTYCYADLNWPWSGMGDPPDWMQALTRISSSAREYIRLLRRNGESLSGPGRVELSTVHGAKGAEADEVVLSTDIGGKVARSADRRPDQELRVLYVGLTRARHHLTLIRPHTPYAWSF